MSKNVKDISAQVTTSPQDSGVGINSHMEEAKANTTISAVKILDKLMSDAGYVGASTVEYNKKVNDGGFNNTAMKLGYSDTMLNQSQFTMDMVTFNRQEIIATYHSSWIFRRIIDKVAQDMWSKGIIINSDADPDKIKKVYKKLHLLSSDLIYGTEQARLFGGAASLMMVDDGQKDLSKPLNLNKIKQGSPIRFYTTDRWYGLEVSMEKVSDFTDSDFGKPMYYTFTLAPSMSIDDSETKTQNVKVHHSRVLRFTNRRSPRLVEEYLQGWGISELEHIRQDLLIHETSKASIGSLLSKAVLEIVKIKGLNGIFSGLTAGNTTQQAEFTAQMSALNNYRTSNNLIFLDAENQYQRETMSYSGLDGIMKNQQELIAGAAEMPQVLLYGQTKGGLSSDSPAEIIFYATTILGKQESECRPVLDKLLPVLCKVVGINISELDYEFESIVNVSNDKKTNLLQSTTQVIGNLVDKKLITRQTALEEIKQIQKQTGFGTNIDTRDDILTKMADGNATKADIAELIAQLQQVQTNMIQQEQTKTAIEQQKQAIQQQEQMAQQLTPPAEETPEASPTESEEGESSDIDQDVEAILSAPLEEEILDKKPKIKIKDKHKK